MVGTVLAPGIMRAGGGQEAVVWNVLERKGVSEKVSSAKRRNLFDQQRERPDVHAASAGRTRWAISAPRSRSTRAILYWLWRSSQNCGRLPK